MRLKIGCSITHGAVVMYNPVESNDNRMVPIVQDSDGARVCIFGISRVSCVSNHDVPHADISMKNVEVKSAINTWNASQNQSKEES